MVTSRIIFKTMSEQQEKSDPKKDSGIHKRIGSWLRDSISGINIVQRIQKNLCGVLGLAENDFESELGADLVGVLDQIVRKGKPLSSLFHKPEVWHAFEALARCFPNEMVSLPVKGLKGEALEQELNLFKSLHHYALANRADENRIAEYQTMLAAETGFFEKRRLQKQIGESKTRISERASLFQKLVFSDADRVERMGHGRTIRVDGQVRSLAEITDEFGSLSQRFEALSDDGPPLAEGSQSDSRLDASQPESLRLAPPPFEVAPPPSPVKVKRTSMPPIAAEPEVVDWTEVDQRRSDDDELDKSFRLDF